MKVNLLFGLRMGYDRTRYEPLLQYALIQPLYSYETKDYLWIFKINDIDKVIAIVGSPLVFEESDENAFIAHSEPVREKIYTERYKGAGFVRVAEFPKIFVVTTIINKKKKEFQIPKETVICLWNIVRGYPLHIPVKTATLSERQVDALKITRFHRATGTFDFAKFFGSRGDYFRYVYYPLKCLEFYGLIVHHKEGKVERIKDVWDVTATLRV